MKCLGLKSVTINKILSGKKHGYKVAYWHYHPHHRKFSDGKWHLIKSTSYRDEKGHEYPFPPANYNLQQFIKNEISGGGWFDNRLPDWAPEFIVQAEKALETRKKGLEEAIEVGRPTKRRRTMQQHEENITEAETSVERPNKRQKMGTLPQKKNDTAVVTNTVKELIALNKPQVRKIKETTEAVANTERTTKRKRKTQHQEADTAEEVANTANDLIALRKTRVQKAKGLKIQELKQQVSGLQTKLTEANDTIKQQDNQVTDLQSQTADLQSKLLRAKHIIENLMKAVKDKDEMVQRLKGEVEELRDDRLNEQEEKLLEEVVRGEEEK
jgi:chromosome segregation ATPase